MCEYVCFCFRRPDAFIMESCLNIAASLSSFYVHVEACIVDPLGGGIRSLYITKKTRVVEFDVRMYDSNVWTFVWVKLSQRQRRLLREGVDRIMNHEHQRKFSSWNIFLFHCFAMSCCFSFREPRTRTCTEMTVEIIKPLCPNTPSIANPFTYTPDDVFRLLQDMANKKKIVIDSAKENTSPR
jgi:hypothetical protein